MIGLYVQLLFLTFNPNIFLLKGISIPILTSIENINNVLISLNIFFGLIILTYNILSKLNITIKTNIIKELKLKRIKINFSPLLLLIFISLFEYYIRLKFNISIPGKEPSINIPYLTNIIYYTLISIKLFLVKNAINLYYINHIKKKTIFIFINIINLAFWYALPSLLLGWRGSIISIFVIIYLYNFLILNKKRKKKLFLLSFLIFTPVFMIFLYIASSFRGQPLGDLELLLIFLINRFVGWADALAIENYLKANNFAVFDPLFYNTTLMEYYTTRVRGYPLEAIHANSRPMFSSLKLIYGNYLVVIGAILTGLFLFYVETNIRKKVKYIFRKDLMLYIYFFYYFFESGIFSGDIDLLLRNSLVLVVVYIFLNKTFKFKYNEVKISSSPPVIGE